MFSDVMDNKVYKWSEDNNISVYLEPSGYTGEGTYSNEPGSNGLIPDGDKLIMMQHGDRRVAKMKTNLDKPESSFSTLIDSFEGKKLNSPNDGFLDAHGNLYFTDPPYGLPELMEDPTKELDFQGVYCLMADGELRLLDTLSRPNGIAQSPDGSTLYVAVSDPAHAVWYSYDIEEPGNISNKNLFYDATQEVNQVNPNGLPDGLKIHSKGYLFASDSKGLWIFSPTAKLLARIYTGQATSNCAFNADESTLFITADDHLLSIKLQ
ncbi:SMP-30/gluconolactonase/LRE family protein [Maribacter litopenaei]|uniref:SMP-30/gluconolactonase/LRE family protein n=1 Tax=Maribacter litopenaei TaxID=2976127 RepID=A0ABY5YBL5_9FLAO|nr:SMP-30/gluconolactonase/LRE family protein [Maribacter litopenaei]UWX56226.1 SMP-30/gluconolactonase/LRE family protein [Maribacter litopenaei]